MYLGTMSLNSLNRPRDAFWVTAIASVANIVLDIALIPVLGIAGAAVATLFAMTLNGVLALHLLSRKITVKLEYQPLKHIILASGVMGAVILAITIFIPLDHVAYVFAAVGIGALCYFIFLLKADTGLHNEIHELVVKLGIPWPAWI